MKKFLQEYFKTSKQNEVYPNQELLLESKPLSVSIWIDNNVFYVFDSKPRDKKGCAVNVEQWRESTHNTKPVALAVVPPADFSSFGEKISDVKAPDQVEHKIKFDTMEQKDDVEKETAVTNLEPIPEGEPATIQFASIREGEDYYGEEEESGNILEE